MGQRDAVIWPCCLKWRVMFRWEKKLSMWRGRKFLVIHHDWKFNQNITDILNLHNSTKPVCPSIHWSKYIKRKNFSLLFIILGVLFIKIIKEQTKRTEMLYLLHIYLAQQTVMMTHEQNTKVTQQAFTRLDSAGLFQC